jgi:hypothetical protein
MNGVTVDGVLVSFGVVFLAVGAALALDIRGAATGLGGLSEASARPLRAVPPWRWIRSSPTAVAAFATRMARFVGAVFLVTGVIALVAAAAASV